MYIVIGGAPNQRTRCRMFNRTQDVHDAIRRTSTVIELYFFRSKTRRPYDVTNRPAKIPSSPLHHPNAGFGLESRAPKHELYTADTGRWWGADQ